MDTEWVRLSQPYCIPCADLPTKPRDVKDAPPVELTAVWPRYRSDMLLKSMFTELNRKHNELVSKAVFEGRTP